MHAYVQGPGVELSAFDPVASEFHEDLDDAHDDIVDAHMYMHMYSTAAVCDADGSACPVVNHAYDDYSYAWPAADAYASINAPSIGKRCGLRNRSHVFCPGRGLDRGQDQAEGIYTPEGLWIGPKKGTCIF